MGDMTADVFERYPLLASLDERHRRLVAERGVGFRAPAGTVLFDLDGQCAGNVLILAGEVEVSRPAADGRELLLYRLGPGDTCVLTLGCLLGGGSYQARAVVSADVAGVQLPQPVFQQLLDGSPPFRTAMLGMFARRMGRLVRLLEAVAFGSVEQRLAQELLDRGPNVRATHAQLATAIGSAREVVSRQLSGWAELGWIRPGRGRLTVADPEALRHLAEPLGSG